MSSATSFSTVVGGVCGGKSHAAGEAAEVGVYGQSGHVKSVSEDHVRGFAADSGEFYELFKG